MDFHFVPNLSYGPSIVEPMRRLTDLPLDVHLMVDNPLDMIDAFADAGSDYLTVHVETVDDVPEALGAISDRKVKPGITIRPDTPVEVLAPFIGLADIVLVMSVFPGFGGQDFLESSFGRVGYVAETASKLGCRPLISVDGGVSFENAPGLVKAGANYIVAGTAIFRDHGATGNVRCLREAIETGDIT